MSVVYKFRGVSRGIMVYGAYLYDDFTMKHYIVNSSGKYAVNENTVGIWTGMVDGRGQDIYKDDIVVRYYDKQHLSYLRYNTNDRRRRVVKFNPDGTLSKLNIAVGQRGTAQHLVVIGNIHFDGVDDRGVVHE